MPADPRRAKDLFAAALELPDPAGRGALLDRECGGDPELRRRVEVLLAAHDQPATALERPLAAAAPASLGSADAVVAGRYKRLELLGEGGMGQVWVADQLAPIRRRVALKLIKPGMDSRAVLARFEAERQALALMDHPNIAKVLDAGTTDDGRPYFAMELVKGVPITEFCDARRLTPRERLELFVPVCQAIQHAHQKGVIHRDIKPSNVLVALHDEKPVPKVIDFGVAKAVGARLTDKTVYTGFGALVGTPAYMAPEQATFNQLDIDTRTDVYALGVLLYELLAGSPPFEPERLRRAALDEVLRLVREEEPPRPSARLSTSQARASLAAVRRSDPDKLSRLVRGELDWIVMKALEKDRNRRYETAAGFAADVRRYLDGEAVQAHPPGATYRLRKFARKHRVALTTAAAFAALLLASAVVGGWLAMKARHAERAAEARRLDAERNARRADDNAGRLAAALTAADKARREAEHAAAGLRIDRDLEDFDLDKKRALLRLARDFNELPAAERDLRGFAAVTLLAGLQEHAPLLPQITHGGREISAVTFSPDHQTLLTLDKDGDARLWEVRTVRPIALLRRGAERVVDAQFSPDGRTVFTLDDTGTARFWDVSAGIFRTATERTISPDRPFDRASTYIWLGERRLLTAAASRRDLENGFTTLVDGPLDLWDTATGRLVARIEGTGPPGAWDALIGGGRWIANTTDPTSLRVYSADDGRLLAELSQPGAASSGSLFATDDGRKVAALSSDAAGAVRLRVWSPDAGWAEASNTLLEGGRAHPTNFPAWWGDDTVALSGLSEFTVYYTVFEVGRPKPVASFGSLVAELLPPRGELIRLDAGAVYEARPWRRLVPPPDRKYHPALARFAPDGRFVADGYSAHDTVLIDTATEKSARLHAPYRFLPGAGFVAATQIDPYAVQIRLIPEAGRLDLAPDLIEAYAELALCGEIGPDGQFLLWDETTWEHRRQALAARPSSNADSLLPGDLPNDRLRWLRAKLDAAVEDADKLISLDQLLRRSEALGDPAEAARWRAARAEIEARLHPQPTGDAREQLETPVEAPKPEADR